jgi:hypothetical protein
MAGRMIAIRNALRAFGSLGMETADERTDHIEPASRH